MGVIPEQALLWSGSRACRRDRPERRFRWPSVLTPRVDPVAASAGRHIAMDSKARIKMMKRLIRQALFVDIDRICPFSRQHGTFDTRFHRNSPFFINTRFLNTLAYLGGKSEFCPHIPKRPAEMWQRLCAGVSVCAGMTWLSRGFYKKGGQIKYRRRV